MYRRNSLLIVLTTTALLFPSCARRDGVYPVRGQVFYDGKPAIGALVVFHPVGQASPDAVLPRGQIKEDGSFVLTTLADQDGSPPGDYVVTIEWWQARVTKKGQESDDAFPVNRLPARYASVQASKLRVQIKPENNELPAFRLTK